MADQMLSNVSGECKATPLGANVFLGRLECTLYSHLYRLIKPQHAIVL